MEEKKSNCELILRPVLPDPQTRQRSHKKTTNSVNKIQQQNPATFKNYVPTHGNQLYDHLNRLENKNHMIILTDTEKTFNKIQYSFIVKISNN